MLDGIFGIVRSIFDAFDDIGRVFNVVFNVFNVVFDIFRSFFDIFDDIFDIFRSFFDIFDDIFDSLSPLPPPAPFRSSRSSRRFQPLYREMIPSTRNIRVSSASNLGPPKLATSYSSAPAVF